MTKAQAKPARRLHEWPLVSLILFAILIPIGLSWLATTIWDQQKQKAAAQALESAGGVVYSEQTWIGGLFRDDSLVTVKTVAITGKSVTETSVVHLREMRQLRALVMEGEHVTDATLVHLQGLNHLEALWLDRTRVTDSGLVHLNGLSQLHFLFLNDTDVTDAGLVHLRGLTSLRWLDLGSTKVTDKGVSKLQRALPRCIVHR